MPPPPSAAFVHESATTTTTTATTPTTTSVNEIKAPQHKRVYQACIPCRRRKVKCNLGSVDSPQDPPCQRCRRESKDCFFSATRRKRKTDDDGPPESNDEYVVRNGRKRLHSEASPTPPRTQTSTASRPYGFLDNPIGPPPLTPGGSVGRSQPLRRPNQSSNGSDNAQEDPNSRWENFEAQKVMSREVYGPHDALDLLYKAATNSSGHKRVRSMSNTQQALTARNATPASYPRTPGDLSTTTGLLYQTSMRPPDARNPALDPALSAEDRQYSETRDPGYNEALKAWARFRFVRAGWFTPAEAIAYIEYYYKYLSPLSPISPPTFRDPGTHVTLLTEEPILTVTLLTIATRYMKMTGPGAHCRSYAIHEQLWTYLRGMIERCLWGQEAFGGGFCGSGGSEIHDAQGSSTAPWRGLRKGSLRTLGTVESLMILTEWHPRALHFPPAEATDELMLPDYNLPDTSSTEDGDSHRVSGGVGGKRIESWLEPAWRSDRMCWMLLSNGMGLSYELGVFDKIEEMLAAGGEMARPEYEDEAYRLRASRVKKLLLIYVTQLAGRLGWTNMVPEDLRTSEPAFEQRRPKASNDFNSPGTNTTASNTFNYIPDLELDDQIIHCWSSITTVMRIGNERLFRSRKHTTSIIQNGKYIELLKDFQPMLSTWLKDFESFTLPPYIKHILAIEYEYVRIYLNSLSLQAVVERCTNSTGISGPLQGNQAASLNMAALSPETQSYYGKLPLAKLGGYGEADSEYVKQVVDGSRSLLRTVVEGLLPNGYLKHAPVRTYFRIISGAMFLLKTFALGAPKNEIEISIGLMDRAVDALRNCVVDDVHLGIRFAELLETLTTRLRNRFIHSAAQLQPPTTANSGTQSPANGIQNMQHAGGAENRDSRMAWNPNVGPSNFDQMAGQSGNNPIEANLNPKITATPFDPYSHAQPFYPKSSTPLPAPYAGPNMYPGNGNAGGGDMGDGFGLDRDEAEDFWYLPTGAAFFQNNDQPITQTAEGVNVGGWDLLDLMTMDQFPLGPDSAF